MGFPKAKTLNILNLRHENPLQLPPLFHQLRPLDVIMCADTYITKDRTGGKSG